MKRFLLALLCTLFAASPAHAGDEPKQTNAAELLFLDSDSQAVAKLTLFVPPFAKETRSYPAQGQAEPVAHQAPSSPAKVLQRMLGAGKRTLRVQSSVAGKFGNKVDSVRINLSPEPGVDNQMEVILVDTPEGWAGVWKYALYAGGGTGGAVKVSWVYAEKTAE